MQDTPTFLSESFARKHPNRILVCQTEGDLHEIIFRLNEEKNKRKSIALFGAGRIGQLVFKLLRNKNLQIDFFIDNDREKNGTNLLDTPVFSFDYLASRPDSVILIAVAQYRKILTQLYRFNLLNNVEAVFCDESRLLYDEDNLEVLHYIDSDGKVVLGILEIDIVQTCDLKCLYCSHFSPYRKGRYDANEIIHWFRCWSPKLHPEFLRILGGEPLLHPDLEIILSNTKKYWPDSQIQLVTNARRLELMPDSLFRTLRKIDVEIEISRHIDDNRERQCISSALKKIDKTGLRCYVAESFLTWNALYRIDSDGCPKPHCSDPEKAFRSCTVPTCRSINRNRFHRCTIIANAVAAYEEGVLDGDWNFLAEEYFLQPNCSAEEIVRHLNSGPYRSCMMCPEKHEIFQSTNQIRTKKHIET